VSSHGNQFVLESLNRVQAQYLPVVLVMKDCEVKKRERVGMTTKTIFLILLIEAVLTPVPQNQNRYHHQIHGQEVADNEQHLVKKQVQLKSVKIRGLRPE